MTEAQSRDGPLHGICGFREILVRWLGERVLAKGAYRRRTDK